LAHGRCEFPLKLPVSGSHEAGPVLAIVS